MKQSAMRNRLSRDTLTASRGHRAPALVVVLMMLTAAGCGSTSGSDSSNAPSQAPSTPRTTTPPPGSLKLTASGVYKFAADGTIAIVGKNQDDYYGGTGFIYSLSRRLAVTNAHVIQGLSSIKVRYNDGTTTSARVVGRSSCDDLAVIQMGEIPSTARQLPLGKSADVQPADNVYVLGYPASFQDFMTEKVAFTSGSVQTSDVKASPDPSLPSYPHTIQHSATVNHGNSGGPLLDDHGRVIGINTLTNAGDSSQQVQGQFYSIGIDYAAPILKSLSAGQTLDYMGADLLPLSEVDLGALYSGYADSDAAVMKEYITSNQVDGLLVGSDTDPGSPLDKNFGFGDLITTAQGSTVSSVQDVCDVLRSANPGGKISLGGTYIYNVPDGHQLGDTWTDEIILGK